MHTQKEEKNKTPFISFDVCF